MSVRLNGSTSGYTELDAQASPDNNTLKFPASNGAARQAMRNGATPGTMEFADDLVLMTAQNSTSGINIDFTGIPSWVKRVTVMLQGVSLSGSSHILFQLGTSGGVESSGYNSSGTYLFGGGSGSGSSTAGMFLYSGSAGNVFSGAAVFARVTGNSWLTTGMFTLDHLTGYTFGTAGSKTLSGALDRIRITTLNGTDTFDAGTINVMYE